MVYTFFDKKSALLPDKSVSGSGVNILLEFNEQLDEELHKPIIRKFKKRKVYSGFKDNIWGADLADMQLISKFNKGFRFLLCIIDIFSKYVCVIPLKDKKKLLVLLMLFKKYWIIQIEAKQSLKDAKQTKYGLTKEVNFTIIHLENC